MAGIGFQLKKLFVKKGLAATMKAYFYSVFVTIGPVIISVTVITFLQYFLKYIGISRDKLELIQSSIMYCFIFSVILTSGYCMMVSRYVSDLIYQKKFEDIIPSLYASAAGLMMYCGILVIIFFRTSPLPMLTKICTYTLFIGLTIQMLLGVYVSAVKNYKMIAFGYVYGVLSAFVTAYVITKYTKISIINNVLISFSMCLLIVDLVLLQEVRKYFNEKSSNYFSVFLYFRRFFSLVMINTFYTTGLYSHFFVHWLFTDLAQVVEKTYLYAPYYDIPASFAFLSIMPTLVIFVVKLETMFYDKYQKFFYMINNGACYLDIAEAKKEMIKVMFKEVAYIMEMQLFFSILAIILGIKFLFYVGFTQNMIDMFSILVLGYFCAVIGFVIMTLALYLNDKTTALWITGINAIGGFLLSLYFIRFGESYYGIGFFLATVTSLVVGLLRLINFVKNIEFHIFCKQVSWSGPKEKNKDTIIDKLNRIG